MSCSSGCPGSTTPGRTPQRTRRWTAARASDVIPAPARPDRQDRADRPAWIVLGRRGEGVEAALLDAEGAEVSRRSLAGASFPDWVREQEGANAPRWVWSDAPAWYDDLLSSGVRVARCHDLRLCHAILRASALVTDHRALADAQEWDAATTPVAAAAAAPALF